MKSVKPGRGPSMMGGIASLFAAGFGIVWMIVAFSMGGGVFALFGLFFVGTAITNAVYNFKNAKSKNRYSAFDIVDSEEEPDPWNQRYGENTSHNAGTPGSFCPYCGKAVQPDFDFCPACGRNLPE